MEKLGIHSVLAQQDNSTDDAVDDDAVDDDAVDDDNTLPEADDKAAKTKQDKSIDIQLTGSDEDGDEVTFSLKTYPEHGDLDGIDDSGGLDNGFFGEDSFSVRPYDGKSSGRIGYISIEVDPESLDDGQRPLSSAGEDQAVHPKDEVSLDGTGSYDPDCGLSIIGEISHCGTLSYEWIRMDSSPELEGT